MNRKDELDPQSKASQSGMKNADEGKGGSALSRKDDGSNAQEKVKKEFPEAPAGPVLGMQDERGGVSVSASEAEVEVEAETDANAEVPVEDRAQGYAS